MKEAEGMDGGGEIDAHTNGATPDERLQHGSIATWVHWNYGRRNMHERLHNLALVSNLYSYRVVLTL